MRGTFGDRVDELSRNVGRGTLRGEVEYDQVYAAVQHEGYWLTGPLAGHVITKHPHGGGDHYLSRPLTAGADRWMNNLAGHVLDAAEDQLDKAMVDNVEVLAEESSAAAPVEFGDLRDSAHPRVLSDGVVVYDRPPLVARLNTASLGHKARSRARGDLRRHHLPVSHPGHGLLHPANGGPHLPEPAPTVRPRSVTPAPFRRLALKEAQRTVRQAQLARRPRSPGIEALLATTRQRKARHKRGQFFGGVTVDELGQQHPGRHGPGSGPEPLRPGEEFF